MAPERSSAGSQAGMNTLGIRTGAQDAANAMFFGSNIRTIINGASTAISSAQVLRQACECTSRKTTWPERQKLRDAIIS